MQAINQRISDAIRRKNLTGYKVAQRAGMTAKTLYNITTGKTVPQERIVRQIASVLGVSAEYLFTGKGTMGTQVRENVEPYSCAKLDVGEKSVRERVRDLAAVLGVPERDLYKAVCDVMKSDVDVAPAKGA